MIYGRRPRQLLIVWGVSLLLIVAINRLEASAQALHELVKPFYWIILAVAFYFTWRWLRSRSPNDRRRGDRRHADRRDHEELPGSDNREVEAVGDSPSPSGDPTPANHSRRNSKP
jgi:hypothetical protein